MTHDETHGPARPQRIAVALDLTQTTPPDLLRSVSAVLSDVLAERVRQHEVHGQQDLPDGTGRDGDRLGATIARSACQIHADAGQLQWRHILREEVAEALAESDPDRLEAELLLVAAVAVQWVEAIRRRRAR